ncbi:MAG TPA: fumarylacetoacetate hydrolase family protein [Hyphomicrobiales bacterium]|nr:fumarylacetoacetate hydrolase family protein [Hyphomicrobiales bacterium]
MRLASFEGPEGASWGAVTDEGVADARRRAIGRRFPTLLDALRAEALADVRAAFADANADHALANVRLLPPVPAPGKIVCVGVNYANRNEEYGDGQPAAKYPSLFVRFPESFVGHDTPIERPPESDQFDYEGEIALVVGKAGHKVPKAEALAIVAGATLANEGSVRDWLRHSRFNVTPGKNFDRSGSLGPWMVTADALDLAKPQRLTTRVNGEVRQDDTTDHMIFGFADLIAYITIFTTLKPGDVLLTGTPVGAGARFDPPKWLVPGDVVEVEVPALGLLRNRVAAGQ